MGSDRQFSFVNTLPYELITIYLHLVTTEFIITSAPIPLMDGASPSLEIMSPPISQSSPPSNICVINTDKRVFFFPVELCKTFFVCHIPPPLWHII